MSSSAAIKFPITILALIIFAASCLNESRRVDVTITGVNAEPPAATRIVDPEKNFGTFLHTVEAHNQVNCDSCHQREAGSLELEYSGHDSCIGCHMSEFTNTKSNICAVCHSDTQTVPAPMKAFPAHFNEGFNMKFDHAAHTRGEGLPEQGCVSCHAPAGASQTIPSTIAAHATCFTCHVPDSPIGSCNVCHTTAPYSRTPSTTAVIRAVFRHSDHTLRQGVSCAECHTVGVSTVQSKQVSVPVAVEHFSSRAGAVTCRTCHNDRRAFGEADFANCRRCHTGSGFDMLP